jgi:hypothetical protein
MLLVEFQGHTNSGLLAKTEIQGSKSLIRKSTKLIDIRIFEI